MKTMALLAATALVALPLLALAPTASAFVWCVENNTGLVRDCQSHFVCVGGSAGAVGYPERCQVGVPRDICQIIVCGPGPVLP